MCNDTGHLYHYFNKNYKFSTLTALPFEEARAIMYAANEKTSWIDGFLTRRYNSDKTLRDKFISIGGKPVRTAPVYFTLGENEGMKTWFDNLDRVKIPVSEFDLSTVSFTYGDSFAIFNPDLNTGEEYWGNIYFYGDILKLIDKYGYPEDPPYDMKNMLFPEDKPINHYLKYIEAHVWSDEVLDKYRA